MQFWRYNVFGKAPSRQYVFNHREQLLHIERLGEVAVHAGSCGVLAVLVKGVRRHGDDGRAAFSASGRARMARVAS